MDVRVAVAATKLSHGFMGMVYSHLLKQVQPGQQIVECEIVLLDDLEYVRYHLLRLLEL